MNFNENVKEGLRSVRANMLRSVLTALIIAIGITSLVGILTAIDSIQASVNNSFAELGANAFDIEVPRPMGRRFDGRDDKTFPPIQYRQAVAYQDRLNLDAKVSVSAIVSVGAEIKYESKQTNPNISVIGANEYYFVAKAINVAKGRSFSPYEQKEGSHVVVIGYSVADVLFGKSDPLNKVVNFRGGHYRVIGVMEESGSAPGGGNDRTVIVPLENGRLLAGQFVPTYNISTVLSNTIDFQMAIGEATVLMRSIRGDALGMPDSFKISRSETLADRLASVTGYLKIGGGVIGFITLLGAAIGLMNIMLVSVTERTREIGIRKALGATPFRIRQQFLIEAIVICQIGGVAGVIFGLSIGNVVAVALGGGAFIVPWVWIMLAFAVCVFVGVVAGYYPAYKASRLDPIESLRFE
ncbi:MAG: FtsX-like permease family protein [Bacteroidetes bacterium]|nr:MAG: FtsX-like permease family protein [Bacteroidota bacterium]